MNHDTFLCTTLVALKKFNFRLAHGELHPPNVPLLCVPIILE
jgi:hypothetical protein